MWKIIAVISCAASIGFAFVPHDNQRCRENEVYSNCSNAICRAQRCEDRGIPVACPGVSSCDKSCVCDEGFLRNSKGACVAVDQCDVEPQCLQNEVYSNCSNALCRAQNCEERGIALPCPGVSSCDKSCVCAEGFLRNSNRLCVEASQCDIAPQCPEGEEYSMCANANCQCVSGILCPQVSRCIAGCVCGYGFVRTLEGKCIDENQCRS